MFHPSSPTSLSLALSFILKYVTIFSQAKSFTITMMKSEDPLSIVAISLSHLGLKSSFSFRGQRPRSDGLSPGKIDHFLFLPTFFTRFDYGKVLGFVGSRQLTLSSGLSKVHFRLGRRFDYGFLQIPHWQLSESMLYVTFKFTGSLSRSEFSAVSSDTLALV